MPLDWGRVRLATESLKGWFLALGLTPLRFRRCSSDPYLSMGLWCIDRFGERKPDCSFLAASGRTDVIRISLSSLVCDA